MSSTDLFQLVTNEQQPSVAVGDNARYSSAELLGCLEQLRAMVVQDLDAALRGIERVAVYAKDAGDRSVLARIGSVRAHALNYATRFEEAADCAEEAVRTAEEIGEPGEAARARMTLVHTYAKLGRLKDASDAARQAESSFLNLGETDLAVRALSNGAIVTRMMGDGEAALEMFRRALTLTEHDAPTRAQIESGLAEALLDLGRYEEGAAAFVRSAETFESAGVTRAAAIVRGSLADLFGRQGRLADAIAEFEKARCYFEEDSAFGELGRVLTEQADVYAMSGLLDDAIANYRRAGDLLDRAGLVQEQARALIGLGRLLSNRDIEAALGSLERAAALSESAGNAASRAIASLYIARLEFTRGAHERALLLADSAAEALVGRSGDLLLCASLRADVLIATSRFNEAEAGLSAAMPLADEIGAPLHMAELLSRRAIARRHLGRSADALDDARAAIDVIERIRSTLQGSRFRAGLVGGSRSMYECAVGLLIDEGGVIEAFEMTERARGRTLLDVLGGGTELDAMTLGDDENTQKLLADLVAARAALNAVYASLDPTAGSTVHGEWLGRVRTVEDRVTALETRLHSSQRARGVLGVPERFSRIISEVGSDSALVSYWFDGGTLRCFLVRDGRVETINLGVDVGEVEQAVQDTMFQIRRGLMRGAAAGANARRIGACRESLRTLHEMIWKPISDAVDGIGNVSIVPAGALHAVPFTALFDGREYLIERAAPVLLPSASVLPLLRRSQGAQMGSISVIAVPDRLAPEIEAEAYALKDVLPGAAVVVGEGATAGYARACAAEAGVLHLACHGAFPASNPLAAGLKLADRWITVRDVLSWRLPGSVVVLSGCDTGRNSLGAGEELYGFGRGFLAAGARGLVMSLWSAHDATTRSLMVEMYRSLDSGDGQGSVRRALGLAQCSQISAGTHPAFWSNFGYLGV